MNLGATDMETPVAPSAGVVDQTSGVFVVVNDQVAAVPSATPALDWTEPLTVTVYVVPGASGALGVRVAVFDALP